MLYSVRMRSAAGGDHACGGRHISGAEALTPRAGIAAAAGGMIERALTHSRGCADFINITIDAVKAETVRTAPLLAINEVAAPDVAAGRAAALKALVGAGVALEAAERGLAGLCALTDSMRGAMLVCACCGARLDDAADRGIRVTRLDAADKPGLAAYLAGKGLDSEHTREALVLAAKVAAAPGTVAELCWSDDPEYTAGYVASRRGYFRFPHLKARGDSIGGRVFFVRPECNIPALTEYLECCPVLVAADREALAWISC